MLSAICYTVYMIGRQHCCRCNIVYISVSAFAFYRKMVDCRLLIELPLVIAVLKGAFFEYGFRGKFSFIYSLF